MRSTTSKIFYASSVLGICLSLYALYVEIRAHDPIRGASYRALCDISESISCSRVFTSRWGRGLGLVAEDSPFNLPNPILGIIHYLSLILLCQLSDRRKHVDGSASGGIWEILIFLSANLSLVASAYLAYILIFELHDFCIVCVSTYVCNLVIAAISYKSTYSSVFSRKRTPKPKNKSNSHKNE